MALGEGHNLHVEDRSHLKQHQSIAKPNLVIFFLNVTKHQKSLILTNVTYTWCIRRRLAGHKLLSSTQRCHSEGLASIEHHRRLNTLSSEASMLHDWL